MCNYSEMGYMSSECGPPEIEFGNYDPDFLIFDFPQKEKNLSQEMPILNLQDDKSICKKDKTTNADDYLYGNSFSAKSARLKKHSAKGKEKVKKTEKAIFFERNFISEVNKYIGGHITSAFMIDVYKRFRQNPQYSSWKEIKRNEKREKNALLNLMSNYAYEIMNGIIYNPAKFLLPSIKMESEKKHNVFLSAQ